MKKYNQQSKIVNNCLDRLFTIEELTLVDEKRLIIGGLYVAHLVCRLGTTTPSKIIISFLPEQVVTLTVADDVPCVKQIDFQYLSTYGDERIATVASALYSFFTKKAANIKEGV